jgi:DNA-binding winged helix-turn-helix (wHTH) protein
MNRSTRIALGDLRVDLDQRRLFLKDSPIAVRQRAIDVLIALVEAEGQIVSRDQLMADVWRGRSVQQSNLQVCVATLRKLFSEYAGGKVHVVTELRRGYRLTILDVHDVHALRRAR